MISEQFPVLEEEVDGFALSTDQKRLDVPAVHAFLSEESYWCPGISIDTVRRAIENSICVGLYSGARQIGFARLVTDAATFAWLADVYVLAEFREQKLGVRLVDFAVRHPAVTGLKRIMLGTRDAHELYRRFGFTEAEFLQKRHPDPYGAQPKR